MDLLVCENLNYLIIFFTYKKLWNTKIILLKTLTISDGKDIISSTIHQIFFRYFKKISKKNIPKKWVCNAEKNKLLNWSWVDSE